MARRLAEKLAPTLGRRGEGQVAPAQVPTPQGTSAASDSAPPATLAENPAQSEWVVWTSNGSCWKTCCALVTSPLLRDAQFVLFQETRLKSDEDIRSAVEFLGSQGWLGQFVPAVETEDGGLSGGVCIAHRNGLNIGTVRVQRQPDASFAHRVLAIQVHKQGMLPHLLVSAYFKTCEAMKGVNLEIYKYLAMLHETEQVSILVGATSTFRPTRSVRLSSVSGLALSSWPLAPQRAITRRRRRPLTIL